MTDQTQDAEDTTSPLHPAIAALGAVGLYWLVVATAQAVYFGQGAEFNLRGPQWALAHTALILAGLLMGAGFSARSVDFPRVVVWTFLLGAVINPFVCGWLRWRGEIASEQAWYQLYGVQLLSIVLLLLWKLGGLGLSAGARIGVVAGYVGAHAVSLSILYYEPIIVPAPEDSAESSHDPIDIEALYGAQGPLMSDQIAALAPERPGQPDVYALLLGGTADQSVFLSEVENVGSILAAQYGSASRMVRLVNSDDDPLRYPMANRSNLEAALTALSARAGPEDLMFLFLTSHGRRDIFSLSFDEAGTSNLTAGDFAAMLDRVGIGPSVIVVSACHSGSFIDDIAAADRLVITAARADRTSFGCKDGGDWTEFGRSFFDVALQSEPDPRLAFAKALPDIERKEVEAERRASLPQISEGAGIGAVLDRVLAAGSGSASD